MDSLLFENFVGDVVEKIDERLTKNQLSTLEKVKPEDFEYLVFQTSEELLKERRIDCKVAYTEGSHAFPDIVYCFGDGSKYGIEVKSSTSDNASWIILGNSIVGSTRKDVLETYIIFIKVSKRFLGIKYGKYEDVVSDVVVTHSPRYRLNMEQSPEESFFKKSGILYQDMLQSDQPIALVTSYFRRQGRMAWWLNESAPATIRSWSELSEEEKSSIYGRAFLFFPEILSSNNANKYKRLAKWLAATYSVVDSSLRDKFTAGGRENIEVCGIYYENMPQVMKVFKNHVEDFKKAMRTESLFELRKYWNDFPLGGKDSEQCRKNYWFARLRELASSADSYTSQQEEMLNRLI